MPILRQTNKLSCVEFGAQLLETNDLDPVYVILYEARLDREELLRFLLSYWCFYHVGTASWCVDGWTTPKIGDAYWSRMVKAASSKDYPRCHERRHFRSKFAVDAVTKLSMRGVDTIFEPLLDKQLSLQEVFSIVTSWYGFGNWIAFKVADMLERLGLAEIEFSTGSIFMFDSPRKGAQLLWKETNKTEPDGTENEWAIDKILTSLGDYMAPPLFERPINVQEAETILCKWKSYMGGHYKIGEDIEACEKALLKFPDSQTSKKLFQAGKRANLWGLA